MSNSEDKKQTQRGMSPTEKAVLGISGVAAASPFAGLIGQKELVNDPHLNKSIKRMTVEELGRAARPGDVMVSTRPGMTSGFKAIEAPLLGSEFYHASPIMHQRGGKGMLYDAGDLAEFDYWKPGVNEIKRKTSTIPEHAKKHKYGDMMLVRPDKKMTRTDQEVYQGFS